MQTELEMTLEQLIDRHGLLNVVRAVSVVCDDKAARVENAMSIGEPDKVMGRAWRTASKALARAIPSTESL